MDRNVPPQFKNNQLRYVTTIKGEGGDLSKLRGILKYKLIGSTHDVNDKRINLANGRCLYVSVETPTEVQFDIYQNKSKKNRDTSTTAFRKDVGEICTIMLQTGYTVSSVKVEELEEESIDLLF